MNNDLISRSALIKWIDDSVSQYGHTYSTDMLMWALFKDYLINKVPTVPNEYMRGYEAAEREYKRPTGKWIPDNRLNRFVCSECGAVPSDWSDLHRTSENCAYINRFCRCCGAKMKEDYTKEVEDERT